jgi:hypothetical protein
MLLFYRFKLWKSCNLDWRLYFKFWIYDFQANDARKKVGSTKGMQTSVETSKLLKFRAEQIVPNRIEEMIKVKPILICLNDHYCEYLSIFNYD